MPKAISPFLSSLRGTLKGGPTFRANPQTDGITMQTKPVPTGTPTAKQAAVRAAYSRLAYLWSNLSHLDKEPYEIMAETRQITSWNAFLSFHMPIMCLSPIFYTVMAEGSGTNIQNFAINGTTGTINGPLWDEQNNQPVLSFDGVDDRVSFLRPHSYDTLSNFTVYMLIKSTKNPPGFESLITTAPTTFSNYGFALYGNTAGQLVYALGYGTGRYNEGTGIVYPRQSLASIGWIRNGTTNTFYINESTKNVTLPAVPVAPSTAPLRLGFANNDAWPYKGNLYLTAIFANNLPVATLPTLDAHYKPHFD